MGCSPLCHAASLTDSGFSRLLRHVKMVFALIRTREPAAREEESRERMRESSSHREARGMQAEGSAARGGGSLGCDEESTKRGRNSRQERRQESTGHGRERWRHEQESAGRHGREPGREGGSREHLRVHSSTDSTRSPTRNSRPSTQHSRPSRHDSDVRGSRHDTDERRSRHDGHARTSGRGSDVRPSRCDSRPSHNSNARVSRHGSDDLPPRHEAGVRTTRQHGRKWSLDVNAPMSDAGYPPMPPTQACSLPGNEIVHFLDPPVLSSRPTVRLAYPPEYREYPRAPSTYLESPTSDFRQHHTQEHPCSSAGHTTTRADPPMDSPPPVATSSAVALYDGEPGERIVIGSLVQSFSYLADGRGEPAIPATPPLYSSMRQSAPLYPTSHMTTLLSAPHPTSESPRTPSSPPSMIGGYYTTTSTATLVNGEPAGEAYRDSLAQPSHHPRKDPYAAADASTLPPRASASWPPSTTRPTRSRRQRRTDTA